MYRIVQWGTGNVGRQALRTILERPDFELVGLRVYNPDKVGMDAGELLDRDARRRRRPPTTSTRSSTSTPTASVTRRSGRRSQDAEGPLDDLCRLLASGKNVVSSAVEFHAYFRPGFHPKGAGEHAHERLTRRVREGQDVVLPRRHQPRLHHGPLADHAVAPQPADRPLTVTEVVDMGGYPSIHMVRDAIGFGLAPDQPIVVDQHNQDVYESAFYVSMRMVADAIGVEIDDVQYHREVAVTDARSRSPPGRSRPAPSPR